MIFAKSDIQCVVAAILDGPMRADWWPHHTRRWREAAEVILHFKFWQLPIVSLSDGPPQDTNHAFHAIPQERFGPPISHRRRDHGALLKASTIDFLSDEHIAGVRGMCRV